MQARKTKGHTRADRNNAIRRSTAALAIAVGCILPLTASAQDADLPKAEVLLDKMVEAIGGKAAHQKIKNRVTKGTFSVPAQGLDGTLEVYEADPDKHRSILEIANIGKVQRGCDGKCVWEIHPMMGARVLEGKEKEGWLREVRFHGDLYWRERYEKVECQGIEEVQGKPCYKVVLTPTDGSPETWFLDKSSFLRVKSLSKMVHQMGEISIESYMADFKKVDHLMLPHTLTQSVMGMKQVIKVESIEHNVKIPPDKFEIPSEIKALLGKEDETEADSKTAEK